MVNSPVKLGLKDLFPPCAREMQGIVGWRFAMPENRNGTVMVQAKVKYQDIFRHHAWLAASVFVLVLGAAFVGSKLQTPVYGVRAEIYVEPKPSSITGEAPAVSANADYVLMNNQVEILSSDRVAKKAADYIQKRLGKRFPVSEAILEKSLNITRKDYSSVITLDLNASVQPKELQTMMQEYLRAYRDTLETINSDKSSRERDFLETQLASAQGELDDLSVQIRDFEARNQTYNLDTQVNQMLQLSNGLDEQGRMIQSDIQAALGEISTAQKMLPASAEFVNLLSRLEHDPESNELRRRMIALEAEKAEWASKVTEVHPKMMVLNQELDRLKALLEKRLETFGKAFRQKTPIGMESITTGSPLDFSLAEGIVKNRIRVDSLRAKAQAMRIARQEVMAQLSGIPRQAIEYASLKNRFDMAQEKVRILQKRLDDATLMREASKSFTKVEVLKNPGLPTAPIRPSVPRNMLAAALLGLCLAGVSVFVKASLDRTFRWPFQLKGLVSQPVFQLDKLPPRKAFAAMMERGSFTIPEAYKRLILHLEQLSQQENVRRIGLLPVGVFPDRGIPTVALSLYFTELGNKVSLIDLDFSKASVTGLIGSLKLPISVGIQEGPGLSDYLGGSGDTELVDIIYPLGKTVYGSLIPAGDPVADASVAFTQRSLSELENELSPNYRFVFYSLPAITQSYDAVAVSRILDGVMLVAYPGVSSLDHIQQAIRELEIVNGKLLGIIVQPV